MVNKLQSTVNTRMDAAVIVSKKKRMDAAVKENKAMEQKTIFSQFLCSRARVRQFLLAKNLKYITALHFIYPDEPQQSS